MARSPTKCLRPVARPLACSFALLFAACAGPDPAGGGGGSGGDLATPGPGGGDGGAATSCDAPHVVCAGRCVDPMSDARHCGGCDKACASGYACEKGGCVLSCPEGQTACEADKVCADVKSDPRHCGDCATACKAGEVCAGGKCAANCPMTLATCGGACVDTQVHRAHCGACDVACKGGEICEGGRCVVSCQAGLTECGGACVDVRNHRAHCGVCDAACRDGEGCVDGKCVAAGCPMGQVACGGRCADTQSDRAHCGACNAGCRDGEICKGGRCEVSCPGGQVVCAGRCVDAQSDRAHCGNCGAACKAGEVCAMGRCALDCPAGQMACGGGCFDTRTDRAHCGDCATACKAGEVCQMGRCALACPGGQAVCGNACVDTMTDAAHCGKCSMPCADGNRCVAGKCVPTCMAPLAACPGGCVDTRNDPDHCGGCGRACPAVKNAERTCIQGVCGSSLCKAGFADCDNSAANGCEADLGSNAHCGFCGNACTVTEGCFGGACRSVYAPGGPRTNVAASGLSGWSRCYLDRYDNAATPVADVLKACRGESLMLACRATGSQTLQVLAWAPRMNVLFNAGMGNVTRSANGSEWYFSDSHSWGFAPAGLPVNRNDCDTVASRLDNFVGSGGSQRLCWHTRTQKMSGGWRCGTDTDLNMSVGFERVVYEAPPSVLVLGAPDDPAWSDDVQSKLHALGGFLEVDVFDAAAGTPTATQLAAYSAVLAFDDLPFANPTTLGDNLATYYDNGGRVVLATFAGCAGHLGGRFGNPANGYLLLSQGAVERPGADKLGTIDEPQSPLMAGVTTLSAAQAFRCQSTPINGATVVARWAKNMRPLVVRGTVKGRARVDLNFYPPSVDSRNDFWTGDGARLLKNALLFQ